MTITTVHFTTISGHFSANYIFIFHKKEVQTIILRCLTGLNLDWFKRASDVDGGLGRAWLIFKK